MAVLESSCEKDTRTDGAPKNRVARHFSKEAQLREKWRRTTGLTFAHEADAGEDERRDGIARLVSKLRECATVNGERLHRRDAESAEDAENGWGGSAMGGRGTPALHKIGCTTEWMPELAGWARVACGGVSLENFCREQGLSRAKLTELTREHCNLSAGELFDGFKLEPLKGELLAQLRVAARALWGFPGDFSQRLMFEGARAKPASLLNRFVEKSKYYNAEPVDWETLRGGVLDRTEQLIASLMRMRATSLDLETLAIRLGFASASRLKRACINVHGQPLSAIERILAAEIVEYYLCAEEKVLRDAASRRDNTGLTAKARYLYSGDEDYCPEAPFLDRWSAAEAFKAEWLSRMREQFG